MYLLLARFVSMYCVLLSDIWTMAVSFKQFELISAFDCIDFVPYDFIDKEAHFMVCVSVEISDNQVLLTQLLINSFELNES